MEMLYRYYYCLLLFLSSSNAFVPKLVISPGIGGLLLRSNLLPQTFKITDVVGTGRHMSSSHNNNENDATTPMTATQIIIEKRRNPNFVQPATTGIASKPSEKEQIYPLDIPSPILLATSIFLAIVSTGSIYQFVGSKNPLDNLTPAAIALVGLPLCIFLFYAAITKATAETEEDDRKFLSGK